MLLKYPDEVRKAFGKKQYHDEIDYIVTNDARNNLIKNFKFKKFEMPFDLKQQKDPIRSWTIKSNKNRLMINGLSIIQPQTPLTIKLRNFK